MTYEPKTIDGVKQIAGERLFKLLQTEYFNGQERALVDWFYKPNKSMEGNSPYDICKRGDEQLLEDAVLSIALGGSGL
ncbi:MAG: hypothetical protein AABW53_01760 [Nanoarchaeota archaeon]